MNMIIASLGHHAVATSIGIICIGHDIGASDQAWIKLGLKGYRAIVGNIKG